MSSVRIILLSLVAALLAACSSQSDTPVGAQAAVPVLAAVVEVRDVPLYIETVGTLEPAASVEVKPQVTGLLQAILVQEGDNVPQGTPLMVIESSSYKVKLLEARASLAKDKAALTLMQKKVERHQNLSQRDLISKMEWEQMLSELAQTEALVAADEARVAAADLDVQNCTLKAPIAGRMGKLEKQVGSLLSAQQIEPLITIADIGTLEVKFNLTEKEWADLAKAQKHLGSNLEVVSILDPELSSKGSWTFYDNGFDYKTGLIRAAGKIPNQDQRLFAGQGVRVKLPLDVIAQAKLIPSKAVRINQRGPYVYVIGKEEIIALKQVELGKEFDGTVIVLSGLDAGEKVVTDGHLRLMEGAKVEISTEGIEQ